MTGSCGSSAARQVALTPDQATYEHWRNEYAAYHERQAKKQLGAAFCRIETVAGREALATNFDTAPVFTRTDWENRQMNVQGFVVSEETGDVLERRIAEGGTLLPSRDTFARF
jgi:surface antigen